MLVGQYTADIAQYDSEVKYWQAEVDYTNIRSPINGRIGIRASIPAISSAPRTIRLSSRSSSCSRFRSSSRCRQRNWRGMMFRWGSRIYRSPPTLRMGLLRSIAARFIPSTIWSIRPPGTIKLKASFDNKQYKLWPGDFVDCRIQVDKRPDGLTVPTASVHQGPKGDFVWVIKPDNTADRSWRAGAAVARRYISGRRESAGR